MAILIVASYTVPVQGPDGISLEYDVIGGDNSRMFDGSMRSMWRSRKRRWSVTTRLLTSSERDSLITAIHGTAPLTCSGDALGGTVSCVSVTGSTAFQWTKGQIRYRVAFTLHEQ